MKTDSELQTDVHNELKWWPNVNAAHVGVTAKDGVVTINGQVAHYAEKYAAEKAVRAVYGVKGIVDDIKVEVSGSGMRTDQDIAEAALNALKWDFEVPQDSVTVTVKDGWVSLEGEVHWEFQKDAAARCVRYLHGVKSVANLVLVKPSVKWIDVTKNIEEAFRRNADLEARRIHVSTDAGVVTLTGTVSSWSERNKADYAAWAAPGVRSVKDEIVVVP